MLVNRITFHIKVGCMETAIPAAKAEIARMGIPGTVMTVNFGRADTLIADLPFENLAALEAFFEKWGQDPQTPDFWKVWNTVIEPGTANEVLVVQ